MEESPIGLSVALFEMQLLLVTLLGISRAYSGCTDAWTLEKSITDVQVEVHYHGPIQQ